MQTQISKPFVIDRQLIRSAYDRVKQNKGSAGIDTVGLKEYEQNLADNLYFIMFSTNGWKRTIRLYRLNVMQMIR